MLSLALLSEGPTFALMLEAARGIPGEAWAAPYLLDERSSWAMRIDPYQRSFTADEKKKLIQDLEFLGFKGKVKVNYALLPLCMYCLD